MLLKINLLPKGTGGWKWPGRSCAWIHERHRLHQLVQEHERNTRYGYCHVTGASQNGLLYTIIQEFLDHWQEMLQWFIQFKVKLYVLFLFFINYSVSYTLGLPGHRENNDRETTESSEWHRMVLEELKYCEYQADMEMETASKQLFLSLPPSLPPSHLPPPSSLLPGHLASRVLKPKLFLWSICY